MLRSRVLFGIVVSMFVGSLLLAGCSPNLDGLDFDVDVTVRDDTATIAVDIYGIKNPALVHVHLFLNDGPEIMMYAETYTYRNLEPGEYELVVELAGEDHAPLPGHRKTFTFVIGADES